MPTASTSAAAARARASRDSARAITAPTGARNAIELAEIAAREPREEARRTARPADGRGRGRGGALPTSAGARRLAEHDLDRVARDEVEEGEDEEATPRSVGTSESEPAAGGARIRSSQAPARPRRSPLGRGAKPSRRAVVHDHAVLPPERHDGQVVRRAPLHAARRSRGARPGRASRRPRVGQPIHHAARVAAAVVAGGRRHRRVEGEVVEVGVADAHPGERAELEVAARGRRRRACPTRTSGRRARCRPRRAAPGWPRRAGAAPAGSTSCRRGGSAARAGAVGVGVAGAIEEPAGAARVVRGGRGAAAYAQCSGARSPVAGRAAPPRTKRTRPSRSRASAIACRTRRSARRRVAEVEGEVGEARSRALADARGAGRGASQSSSSGSSGSCRKLTPPRCELEHPDDLVGHDPDDERVEARRAVRASAGFGSRTTPLAAVGSDQPERARADRRLAGSRAACGRAGCRGPVASRNGANGAREPHDDRRGSGASTRRARRGPRARGEARRGSSTAS